MNTQAEWCARTPLRPSRLLPLSALVLYIGAFKHSGSPDDIYYYSPWRAPGSAPTIDACGSAGGRFPGQGRGGAGAQFYNSSVAKEGDVGSKIPKGPAAAT